MRLHYFALQDVSDPTGATAHVFGDVRGLQAHGVRVSVTAVSPAGFHGPGDAFHALPPFRGTGGVIRQVLAMRRTVQAAVEHLRMALRECDVAYTRHYMAASIFADAQCAVPWIYEVNALPVHDRLAHGRWHDRLVARRIQRHFVRTLRDSHRIVVVTPELKTTLIELYGVAADRICVVPNGVDTRLFHPDPDARSLWRRRWGFADATPLIGYVGNCAVWQRFDLLLEALPRVRARVPEARVVIVGEGAMRTQWELAVAARGLSEMVHFAGGVSLQESAGVIASLDIALDLVNRGALDALVGTSAVKVRTAMACAVPLVAVRIPGVTFIEKVGAGRIAELDSDSLATVLLELLEAPAVRAQLGAAGRAYAEAHLDWVQIGARLRALADEVLGQDAPAE